MESPRVVPPIRLLEELWRAFVCWRASRSPSQVGRILAPRRFFDIGGGWVDEPEQAVSKINFLNMGSVL